MREPARSGATGGWAHGPCEAWVFAARLSAGNDRDKRMAMLIVDNAVELALKTYLNLHRRQRGGPPVQLDLDPAFVALLDGFEECFDEWPGDLTRSDLLWFHEVRNLLHHRGNGLTPDDRHLRNYIAVAETLLRFLFGDAPVEEAQEAEGPLPRQVTEAAPSEHVPSIIVELDELIARIRRRAAELPLGADPQLALPVGDILELAEHASDVFFDRGGELDEETQELLAPYTAWAWDVDGVPSTLESTISELENLRVALTVILM